VLTNIIICIQTVCIKTMADISLNENRLALLIWQTSNLWQSKVRHKLKESQITLNEYLILETIYLLQQENINITQQDICKNASIDRSVVSLRVSNLEEKKLISKQQPQDKRSDSLILTAAGNDLINNNGYRSKVDIRNEKIGYKIREATLGRVPLIAVIGDKEEEIDSVALRALNGKNLGIFNLPSLCKLMDELIDKKGRTE